MYRATVYGLRGTVRLLTPVAHADVNQFKDTEKGNFEKLYKMLSCAFVLEYPLMSGYVH